MSIHHNDFRASASRRAGERKLYVESIETAIQSLNEAIIMAPTHWRGQSITAGLEQALYYTMQAARRAAELEKESDAKR